MRFVLLVLALKILEISGGDEKENRERAASLVVLPPLVLGYEELYVDNDDNQPAKKDMDYPNESEEITATEGATPKNKIKQSEEAKQSENIPQKGTTVQTEVTEKEENVKVKDKTDKKDKKGEKKSKKKENKEKSSDKKDKKKKSKNDDKKKDNKKNSKKDTKKESKKKSSKNNKKDKKKDKGKKKGKRKGKFGSSRSSSESDSENSDESQNHSELSDYDTQELNNLQELLNNQPSVYGVERIYPTLPTRAGRMPTGSYNNFNKTYVMGLNLKPTTSSLSKLISLLARRMNKPSVLKGDKQSETRTGGDKGVITLKGQGEIGEGEGKEVLEFTGNFRVPKKVLECPCFKEILEKEKPSF